MSLLASKSTVTLPNTPGPLVTVRLIAVPLVSGSETMTASDDWKRREEVEREREEGREGQTERGKKEGWREREGKRERENEGGQKSGRIEG